MAENERRTGAKLHKQPEIEDDDGEEVSLHHQKHQEVPLYSSSEYELASSENVSDENPNIVTEQEATQATVSTVGSMRQDSSTVPTVVNVSGVRTPTIQSASSSSETSPDEGQVQPVIPPPITRKQTLTRTPALEGTSPPPESFTSQHCSSEGLSGSSPRGSPRLTNGGGEGSSSGQESSSSLIPVPPVCSSTPSPGQQKKAGQSSSQEAKEYLLASHKISSDSGHGTLDTTDAGSDTSVLSRDSSLENSAANLYKDSSGVNIPRFIRETMLKSAKDKRTVLAFEKQLLDFCRNENSHVLKMPEASSYDRMIAHRLSAFMGLEHNVDSTGKCVIINKTDNMRIVKLTDFIKLDDAEQETKKKILLKKPASLDEKHGRSASKGQFGSNRAKSLEERERFYSEARERIFKHGNQPETPGAPALLSANYMPPRIHQQRSLDSCKPNDSRMSMSSSAATSSPGQHHHLLPGTWASMDATSCSRYGPGAADLRASTMVKSNSYGGVGSEPISVPGILGSDPGSVVALGLSSDSLKDAHSASHSSSPSQGSVAAGQVFCPPSALPSAVASIPDQVHSMTPEEVTSSFSTPGVQQQQQHEPQPRQQQQAQHPHAPYAYLVSSDYASIPLGSLIIDPNTMQPHVNADGSLYRFDPSCPPPFMGQPVIQPSPSSGPLSYHMETLSVSDAGGNKFSIPASHDPTGGVAGVTGQLVMAHPLNAAVAYQTGHPLQAQYYPTMPSVQGQPPLQFVALTPAGQGHHALLSQPHILQAAPIEAHQGQATVPMPAIGVPSMPSQSHHSIAPTTYVLGPSGDIGGTAGGAGAASGVTLFTASPYPSETLVGPSPQQHTQQLVQYNLANTTNPAFPGQPQPILQHPQQQHQQPPPPLPHMVIPHSSGAYFTAIHSQSVAPAAPSTPTPPPPHHHHIPPPQLHHHQPHPSMAVSHVHQRQQIPPPAPPPLTGTPSSKASQSTHHLHLQTGQQQPTVFYSPVGLTNLSMSPLVPAGATFPGLAATSNPQPASSIMMAHSSSISSSPSTTTATGLKPVPSSYLHYHSSPPPPPPPPPSVGHNYSTQHHNQQVQHMTHSASGNSQHLPSHTHQPGNTSMSPAVAYHQVRPVGPTIYDVSGAPAGSVGHTSQTSGQGVFKQVTPSVGQPQLQGYQILRPAGPEGLRMMNPGSIRPRQATLPFPNSSTQHMHSKMGHRQAKKGPKRTPSSTPTSTAVDGKDVDDRPLHQVPVGPAMGFPANTATQAAGQPLHLQPHQQQQPLIVAPLLPSMMNIPPVSSHR